MIITNEQKNIAQWAMNFVLKNGCSSARVSVIVGNNNSFEYRNTQLDKLHQSTECKLYIELFVDGRYSSLSSNRMEKAELEMFIKEGIASARYLAEDRCRVLPHSSRYFKPVETKGLDIFDNTYFDYSIEQKIELIRSTVEEVYATDNRLVSVMASYDDGCGAEYMIDSNGFEGETQDTVYSLMAEVALKNEKENTRFESYWFDNKLHWPDLQKSGIASKALERALQKIGRSKIKSGNYPMILDNTVSSRVFSPLISAMYGSAIQQKNTFLLNKLHTQITSPKLTVKDNPHFKKTFGSRWYDGEGVATYEQTIIEKGVLNTYFIDTYNACKLNMEPTIASPSVLTLDMGIKNLDELIREMQTGVWVTNFNGGNINSTTGDFSFGIEGFWIERGSVGQAVCEMNITGNILDLWNNLVEIGNDPFSLQASRQIPSLLFRNVSFSGI